MEYRGKSVTVNLLWFVQKYMISAECTTKNAINRHFFSLETQ